MPELIQSTAVRQDPNTHIFATFASGVPVDTQPLADIQFRNQTAPALLDGQPYRAYNGFTFTQPTPDIRMGDQLVDPNETDPITGLNATYIVMNVQDWRPSHLQLGLGRPVTPANIAAMNAQFIAAFSQSITWLQRITDRTTGALPATGFEPYRGQETVMSDGTYGVGWTTATRTDGYLAPQTISVGRVDQVKVEEWGKDGLTLYQGPVLYFQNVTLQKLDLLIFPDSTRYLVGDAISPVIAYGVTVLQRAKLDAPDARALAYQVPNS